MVIKTDRQDLCPEWAFWYFKLLSVWLGLVFPLRTQCFLGWTQRVFATAKWSIVTSARLSFTRASICNILTGIIIFLAGVFLFEHFFLLHLSHPFKDCTVSFGLKIQNVTLACTCLCYISLKSFQTFGDLFLFL